MTPQDVAAQPFISRETGSGTREFTDQYFRQAEVAPEDLNLVMELGSPEAIKGLEDDLGVALFDRQARGLDLTHRGSLFLRHARTICNLRFHQPKAAA